MPSLKAIRKRIASVKNTKKITAAMKLVAGARLRRAQDAIVAARPYAQRLGGVIADLAARSGPGAHRLFEARDPQAQKKVALIVVTAERGLCGAFNSNVVRRVERFLIDEGPRFTDVSYFVVGRKGREYMRRRGLKMVGEWAASQASDPAHGTAKEIGKAVVEGYLDETYDAVYLVYNEFKSAISQRVVLEPLLPITPGSLDETFGANDFAYEPSREELVEHLVPLHVETQIYRALLESIAGFFGAQMSAMDSATNNAKEMIGSLTLEFNRARQAAITKELMEIVGGAEALKG